ncbi:MAG: roadblock/LC7 domain-containing protein [Leptothrix ochracea]
MIQVKNKTIGTTTPLHGSFDGDLFMATQKARIINDLTDLDGFIAAALVDSTSGMMFESMVNGSFPIEAAAGANTQVVQAKLKAMKAVGIGNDHIEDILITLGTQYHLIRPLQINNEIFIYIAIDRNHGNLAMARMEMRKLDQSITKL